MTASYIKILDDNSGEFISIAVDEDSNSLVTISEPHAHIHHGHFFTLHYYNESVADDDNLDIILKTGALEVHAGGVVNSGGDAIVSIQEGVSYTGGTPLVIFNKNRNSTNTPVTTAFHTPTVTASGVTIFEEYTIGGTYNQSTGANTRNNSEWELKPNTNYLFRTTNKAGLAKIISTNLEFYEL